MEHELMYVVSLTVVVNQSDYVPTVTYGLHIWPQK